MTDDDSPMGVYLVAALVAAVVTAAILLFALRPRIEPGSAFHDSVNVRP